MDKVVDHLFVFHGDGHIQDFPGNYTQYRLEQGTKTKEPRANTTENKTEKIKTEQKRRLSFKEKKELEQLNLLLPQLEAEKAQLESILASGTASADEITTTSQRYQQLLEELDIAEMRWLELSEFAE
jgi:ATP-binding cassette subfamily F protein uup